MNTSATVFNLAKAINTNPKKKKTNSAFFLIKIFISIAIPRAGNTPPKTLTICVTTSGILFNKDSTKSLPK